MQGHYSISFAGPGIQPVSYMINIYMYTKQRQIQDSLLVIVLSRLTLQLWHIYGYKIRTFSMKMP